MAGPFKDAGIIDRDQGLMGLPSVGFLGLFLTQPAGVHGDLFPLPGCMAVNTRR